MPRTYVNVSATESALGTVVIYGQEDYAASRRVLRRIRAGCASVETARVWLTAHAPNGWSWRYPDGARVHCVRRGA